MTPSSTASRPARRWPIAAAALAGLVAGAGAVALADTPARVDAKDRTAIEAVVRDYILKHPEVIPEALTRMQEKDTADRIGTSRTALETPFAGAWAGAARPDVTLVMFTDYACGYCRASVADVDRLLASDPRLRVVWREIPILGPRSEAAARIALAVARQGHYPELHRRIFAGGVPDAGKVGTAAKLTGADMTRVTADAKSPTVTAEIDSNLALAQKLGVNGTPAFFVGNQMLSGAVGYDALRKAVADARKG